ncbi:MAG: RNA-binding S4 domain-containing protein [Thermoleophilia bacterium]|nr:RNA-binding S4 domain-containing protein [Thermoleophilia bacterium]
MSRDTVTRQVIVSGTLTLGQLLKFADVVQSGGEAKELIASGAVTVDGVVETRRGRKLVGGERVAVGRELLAVVLKER